MKKTKLLVGIVLSAATVFSTVACDNLETIVPTAKSVDVWAKEGHVKVFADKDYDESFRQDLAVDIGVCKNEYEAAQIILTANDGNVRAYDIEITDLKNSDGDVFSKENIKVYNQKYINVDSIAYEKPSLGTGWYPDALLPFETAVKYGENKVEQGNNQGIYIEAYIPEETEAGVYTGNFTLTVDGKKHNVPAKVTVYDYKVSEYNHLASLFSLHAERSAVGEMGWTEELNKAYRDTFMEFRVSITGLGSTLKEWSDNFRIYCNPEKTPNTSTMGTISIGVEKSGTGINQKAFRERLTVATAASLLDGIDYVDLLDTRSGQIDEPHLNGTHDLVNTFIASFNEARNLYAADLLSGVAKEEVKTALTDIIGEEMSDAEFDAKYESMKQQLSESAAGVLCVVTTLKDSRLTVDDLSYCVTRSGSTSAKDREYYKDLDSDQWWYFCGSGMDVMGYGLDSPLLEARMIGWASYDYEYVGDVCWETVLYTDMEWSTVGRVNVETACDPYAVATRCGIAPGDGYLVYPGKPYGLDKPVTCVRLHAIRDGREEYEMLYDLEQKYAAKGYSPRSILNVLFKDLYKDIELTTNADEVFTQSRETLIQLCMLANKGIYITDYEQIGTNAKATLRCEGDVKAVKINGEAKAEATNYAVTVSLENASNTLAIEFNDGTDFKISLGNKQTVLKNLTVVSDLTVVSGAELSANTVDGVTGVKVKMLPVEYGDSTVNLAVSSTAITKNTTSFSVRIYNPNAKKMYVSVFLDGSGGVAIAGDGVIYPGWNTIQINKLASVNWKNVKKLESIQFAFSLGENESIADYDGVTIASVVVEE